MPAGRGQFIFGNVPVVPGSYPDTAPHPFAIKGPPRVKASVFDYGSAAAPWNVLGWYRERLPRNGWRIERVRANTPGPGLVAITATRRGEAVTIVIEPAASGTRISISKFDSAK